MSCPSQVYTRCCLLMYHTAQYSPPQIGGQGGAPSGVAGASGCRLRHVRLPQIGDRSISTWRHMQLLGMFQIDLDMSHSAERLFSNIAAVDARGLCRLRHAYHVLALLFCFCLQPLHMTAKCSCISRKHFPVRARHALWERVAWASAKT